MMCLGWRPSILLSRMVLLMAQYLMRQLQQILILLLGEMLPLSLLMLNIQLQLLPRLLLLVKKVVEEIEGRVERELSEEQVGMEVAEVMDGPMVEILEMEGLEGKGEQEEQVGMVEMAGMLDSLFLLSITLV